MTRVESTPPSRSVYPYYRAHVVRAQRVTPHVVRVSFGGDDLTGFARELPDQYVKLFFPLSGQTVPAVPVLTDDDVAGWYQRYLAMPDDIRPVMRTLTVRRHRAETGEVDVDFVLHGDGGPASRWAMRAQPGDQVGILTAQGLYLPPDTAQWQLIAGDETALPAIGAIGAIVESMPPTTRALVFVEVAGGAGEQPLDTPEDVQLRWVHRGAIPAGRSDALLDAVRGATFPEGPHYAWIAGEARAVRVLRRHLVNDRGFDKAAITFTGYWRLGKTEVEEYTPEELEELQST
ncbi:MAG: siderophore-interacting protein [Egibacteraceae bacterium]